MARVYTEADIGPNDEQAYAQALQRMGVTGIQGNRAQETLERRFGGQAFGKEIVKNMIHIAVASALGVELPNAGETFSRMEEAT